VSTSLCAVFDCDSCGHLAEGECPGCIPGNQELIAHGEQPCGIYACAIEAGLSSCTECTQAACRFYRKADMVCPLRRKLENARWWAGRLAANLNQRRARPKAPKISDRTIDRLRWYLAALDQFAAQGMKSVPSWQLSQRVGVSAALIRKDLSHFGEFGTPSFGYDIAYLRRKIMDILHLDTPKHVVWLGADKLKEYADTVERLAGHNCRIVAVLDKDPSRIGRPIGQLQVLALDNLPQVLTNLDVDAAVIALPGEDAQRAANILTNMGVQAILNLTSELLVVPDNVKVRNVDIAGELLALSYYCRDLHGQDEAGSTEETNVGKDAAGP